MAGFRVGVWLMFGSLVAGIAEVSQAQSSPTIRYYTYSSRTLEVRVAMEDAHSSAIPKVSIFEVRYKPSIFGRGVGRADAQLDSSNVTEVWYEGWAPEKVRYTSWTGMGGGSSAVRHEWSPFKTVEIETDSIAINRIFLTFSRNYTDVMPSLNIYTDRGSFNFGNPQMREVTAAEFGCKRLLKAAPVSTAAAPVTAAG